MRRAVLFPISQRAHLMKGHVRVYNISYSLNYQFKLLIELVHLTFMLLIELVLLTLIATPNTPFHNYLHPHLNKAILSTPISRDDTN